MSFLEWLGGRPAVQAPPFFRKEHGPASDDWKRDLPPGALQPIDADHDGKPDTIAGLCIALEYVDASGASSARRVIANKVYEANGIAYLEGYCLLRNEDRTFRCDRIQSLSLPPDWKAIPNPLAMLQSYLPLRADFSQFQNTFSNFDSDRYVRMYEARQVANHGLRVLAFLARSDGRLDDSELLVIQGYIRDAASLVGVKLEPDEAAEIAGDVSKLFPTKRQVANSIAAIQMYQEQTDAFLSAMTALIQADGEVTAYELSALEMLIEILNKRRS